MVQAGTVSTLIRGNTPGDDTAGWNATCSYILINSFHCAPVKFIEYLFLLLSHQLEVLHPIHNYIKNNDDDDEDDDDNDDDHVLKMM